jgi:hypothetical protein
MLKYRKLGESKRELYAKSDLKSAQNQICSAILYAFIF